MKVTAIHHVRIPVPKDRLDDARRFYGHLGLREVPKPPGRMEKGAWFEAPNTLVWLAVAPDFEPLREQPVLSVQVPDAEAVRRDLTARRAKINDAPALPGGRRFYAFDPVGNKLEFLQKG